MNERQPEDMKIARDDSAAKLGCSSTQHIGKDIRVLAVFNFITLRKLAV